MRPYSIQIPDEHGEIVRRVFVDLDHIIAIKCPTVSREHHSYPHVTFTIVFAFRETDLDVVIASQSRWEEKKIIDVYVDGVLEGVHRITPVFNELFKAWCGKSPDEVKNLQKEEKT